MGERRNWWCCSYKKKMRDQTCKFGPQSNQIVPSYHRQGQLWFCQEDSIINFHLIFSSLKLENSFIFQNFSIKTRAILLNPLQTAKSKIDRRRSIKFRQPRCYCFSTDLHKLGVVGNVSSCSKRTYLCCDNRTRNDAATAV